VRWECYSTVPLNVTWRSNSTSAKVSSEDYGSFTRALEMSCKDKDVDVRQLKCMTAIWLYLPLDVTWSPLDPSIVTSNVLPAFRFQPKRLETDSTQQTFTLASRRFVNLWPHGTEDVAFSLHTNMLMGDVIVFVTYCIRISRNSTWIFTMDVVECGDRKMSDSVTAALMNTIGLVGICPCMGRDIV